MSFLDRQGIKHSERYVIETRNDKYGQNIKLKCMCGLVTNWHCEQWQAEKAIECINEHDYVLYEENKGDQ